jgi:hypothetical protein
VWDPKRGAAVTVVSKAVRHALIDELETWQLSSSQPVGEQHNVPILRTGETGEGVYEEELTGPGLDEEDEIDPVSVVLSEEEGYAVGREGDGASLTEIAEDLDQFFPLPDGARRSRFQARNVLDRALRKARRSVLDVR